MESKIIYEETQKFRQPWIWVILIAASLLPVFILYQQKFIDNDTPSFNALIGSEAIIALVCIFIFNIKLYTQIRTDGIYVRFFPFHGSFNVYKWKDIAKAYVRTYNPVKEYGGWGFRYGFTAGKAYNVSGNVGIQILFKDGSKLLIGTNNPKKAADALKKIGAVVI